MSQELQQKVNSLREQGYQVKTYHTRYFHNVFRYDTGEGEIEDDGFLTKSEYQKALNDGRLWFYGVESSYDYGKQVSPTDGFTVVKILKDGKEVSRGKKNFTNRGYDKRVGRLAAFSQAFGRLSEKFMG